MRRTHVQTAVTLALGAAAGFVIAMSGPAAGERAAAAPPSAQPAPAPAPAPAKETVVAQAAPAVHAAAAALPAAAGKKPNILVIWGDDIGVWNVSAYSRGMMGYRTPNIDRIAKEGAIFTDHYGQQSCTAGRAAFLTGQSCFRTGLLKVGLPGAPEGLSGKDPTIAELLKPLG